MTKPLKKNYTPMIEIEVLTYSGQESLGLDRYIQQCYNLPDSFEVIECANDTYEKFEVSKKPLDGYDTSKAQEAIDKGYCTIYGLGRMLNRMCYDGFIPEGTYLVNMSW